MEQGHIGCLLWAVDEKASSNSVWTQNGNQIWSKSFYLHFTKFTLFVFIFIKRKYHNKSFYLWLGVGRKWQQTTSYSYKKRVMTCDQ